MRKLERIPLNGKLPSPKGVALAILDLCRSSDADFKDIARVAQTDPALTGRLLRQANSAASGGRSVASVTDAIARLGLGTVRNLALGFSLVDQHQDGPCPGFDYAGFWSHSLLMGVAMQAFASVSSGGAADELFACGLLAQVGRLALATAHPQEYGALLAHPDAASRLVELEREHLHTDHTELSAAMLADWGLPMALVEPIYYHESPDDSGFAPGSRPHQLVHLFHLARCVANLGTASENERGEQIPGLLLLGSKFGLDADEMGRTIDSLMQRWREWGELLKVSTAAPPAFALMTDAQAKRGTNEYAMRVLLVEDDATTRTALHAALEKNLGHQVTCASNGREALALALETMPQVVLTDWQMPGLNGLELCRALRASEWGRTMYIVMLTASNNEQEVMEAFEGGVDDFLAKPVDMLMLRARLFAARHHNQLLEDWDRDRAKLKQFAAELAISNRRLAHAAMTDLLTGLPNRRAGMNSLSKAWAATDRSGEALAVLVLDIDHFKTINDTYGHAIGDTTLRQVAQAIERSARKNDSVCRMGGEEFLVICPNTDIKAGLLAAERLRRVIENLRIDTGKSMISVTVSIGVAAREPKMTDTDSLVNAADRALYTAKHSGRNLSCVWVNGKQRCGPW